LAQACSRIPRYQSLRASRGYELQLPDFPIIDAEAVSERPEDYYCLDRFPDLVLTTGGTTAKPDKFYFLNYQEIEAAFAASTGLEEGEMLDPRLFDAAAIILTDLQHGLILPPSHGQPVICLPLEVGRHFKLIERFLREGVVVGGRRFRVEQLFGSITKLRALTAYLEHKYQGGRGFGVNRIVAGAFHTSLQWRKRLETFWGASVQTSYGLTEFIGVESLECAHCGAYHIPKTVYPELLSEDLTTSVYRGPALLVLTTLYPYRVVMPLIRYNTKDYVEVMPERCRQGEESFRVTVQSPPWPSNCGAGRPDRWATIARYR
jgi:hypothetical protein